EDLEGLGRRAGVLEAQLVDLGGVSEGDEHQLRSLDPFALAGDARVPEAMAALERVERGVGGGEAGIPDLAPVVDVEVASTHVRRDVVVAVAHEPPKPRVAVKAVATRAV